MRVEVRMNLLTASIRNDYSLGPELDSLLLLADDNMPVILILLDHHLGLDCGDEDLAANQQLNTGNSVTRVEHFTLHYCGDVMENVVSCVVHEHSYYG